MANELPYADVEQLLTGWLAPWCGCRVLTDLPADLQDQLPVLQLTRFGGFDHRPGLDTVTLDVDAYAGDRFTAFTLAEKVRWLLRFTLPGEQLGTALFTRVVTVEAPSVRPYDDTDLRRFGATYQLTVHILNP